MSVASAVPVRRGAGECRYPGCTNVGDVYCSGCSLAYCAEHSYGVLRDGRIASYVCQTCMDFRLSHYTGVTPNQFIPRTRLE